MKKPVALSLRGAPACAAPAPARRRRYQDGYYIFPFGRFFDMWREGPCAEKAEPYIQAYVTARPRA